MQRKKEKLFIENYKAYKDKIYTYFLYRVNFNREMAEDLTSEVFVKAFKNIDSFEQGRSFQSWIYAISRNHLFNYYRDCEKTISLDAAEEAAVEFRKAFAAKIDLELIIKKIYQMDDYCREVLLLRFVDGLDNKEIAECLEKEEGAIRTQISRALCELRSRIKEN